MTFPSCDVVPKIAHENRAEQQRYSSVFCNELLRQPKALMPNPCKDFTVNGRYRVMANSNLLAEHRIRIIDQQTGQLRHLHVSDANSPQGVEQLWLTDNDTLEWGVDGKKASYKLGSNEFSLQQSPGIGTDIQSIPLTLFNQGVYISQLKMQGRVQTKQSTAHPYTSYHLQLSLPNLQPRSLANWPCQILTVPIDPKGQVNATVRLLTPHTIDFNTCKFFHAALWGGGGC